jgi:hypothetical protein
MPKTLHGWWVLTAFVAGWLFPILAVIMHGSCP